MKIFYSPKYEVDLGEHILPTVKFRLIKERLIELGTARAGDFEEPPPARDDDILLVHTPAYLDKLRGGANRQGHGDRLRCAPGGRHSLHLSRGAQRLYLLRASRGSVP